MAQRGTIQKKNRLIPVIACDPLLCKTCKKYTNSHFYDINDYCILHCYQCNDIEYNNNIMLIEHNNKFYLLYKKYYKIYNNRLKQIIFRFC